MGSIYSMFTRIDQWNTYVLITVCMAPLCAQAFSATDNTVLQIS